MVSRQWSPLRIVTQRIASTPPAQLYQIAPALADTLSTCSEEDFSTNRTTQASDDRDRSVLAHKLKTQLSSLLHEKSRGARAAAVILIKATIENGRREVLPSVEPWARGILGLLNKPEPSTIKRMVILTLTRIFLLTHDGHPALVREVTTPLLPGFITACVNNVSQGSSQATPTVDSAAPLLRTVLQALIKLLPHSPASFRPFIGKLRALLAPTLAPTPSHASNLTPRDAREDVPPTDITALAQRFLVLLPMCAPKNTSSAEWARSLKLVLADVHETANHVFRAVREQGYGQTSHATGVKPFEGTVHDRVDDDLRLPGWKGIYAGAERLSGLLQLVQAHVASTTALEITVPLGSIFAMLSRILSIFEPVKVRGLENEILNPEISREEREGLWACLPTVHVAAVDTIWTVVERVGIASMSFAPELLELLLWVFERESLAIDVCASIYRVLGQILRIIGPSMSKAHVSALAPVLRKACANMLSEGDAVPSATLTNGSNKSKTDSADSYLKMPGKGHPKTHSRHQDLAEARSLVLSALSKLPSENIPKSLRRELDRVSILCEDHDSLLASTLNPPAGTSQAPASSLLPFLARAQPASMGTEALLRPRMPFFRAPHTVEGDDEYSAPSGAHARDEAAFQGGFGSFLEPPPNHLNATSSYGEGAGTHDHGFDEDAQPERSNEAVSGSPKRKRIGEQAPTEVTSQPEKRQRTMEPEGSEIRSSAFSRTDHLAAKDAGSRTSLQVSIAQNPVAEEQLGQEQAHAEATVSEDLPFPLERIDKHGLPPVPVPQPVSNPASRGWGTARGVEHEDADSSGSEIPPIILDRSSEEDGEGDEDSGNDVET